MKNDAKNRKWFSTPNYLGVWLPFNGNRIEFRKQVESYLREVLFDPEGVLEVDDRGPQWVSQKTIHLSYSHSLNHGILIYSSRF